MNKSEREDLNNLMIGKKKKNKNKIENGIENNNTFLNKFKSGLS